MPGLRAMGRWPDYTAQGLQTSSQKRTCGFSATIRCQVEFQAVWQKLDAALKSAVAVAEGSRARWGCQCSGAWDQGASAICGDEALEFLVKVLDEDDVVWGGLGSRGLFDDQKPLPVVGHIVGPGHV